MARKSLTNILAKPTEQDAIRFLECTTYRYLMRILDKVILAYNISPNDAEILRDKLVNMNVIEVRKETEETQATEP